MSVLISIGDFSRMTHLSIKALRFYHDQGLLEPTRIDPDSGYRFYEPAQVPVAQVIRRFRDLDMPLDQVKAVLRAPDLETRTKEIISHLTAMEAKLAELQMSPGRSGTSTRPTAGSAPWWPNGRSGWTGRSASTTWCRSPNPTCPSIAPRSAGRSSRPFDSPVRGGSRLGA